jgi:hypothetical protein
MLLPVTLAAALLVGSLQNLGATEGQRPLPPTAVQTPAAAAPAASPAAQVYPTTQSPAALGASTRLICTSQPVTGSRFPIRTCRTAEQIARDRIDDQELLRRQQGSRTPPVG